MIPKATRAHCRLTKVAKSQYPAMKRKNLHILTEITHLKERDFTQI